MPNTPKPNPVVDLIMDTIPESWRYRWCGGEKGPCACLGCVQIGNRKIMAAMTLQVPLASIVVDPERIDESKIPTEIRGSLKLTRTEWESWCERNPKEKGN